MPTYLLYQSLPLLTIANNPDISFVIEAAEAIVPYVRDGNFIILESTSPIGTTEKMVELFKNKGVETRVSILLLPRKGSIPGKTMKELVENDRICRRSNKGGRPSCGPVL
jgi:UDP-N-acetyl-D-mannosaminuronic acid dehydrogenase